MSITNELHKQQVRQLSKKYTTNTKTINNLDLVGIHRRVGNQDSSILDSLRLIHTDLLVQKKT